MSTDANSAAGSNPDPQRPNALFSQTNEFSPREFIYSGEHDYLIYNQTSLPARHQTSAIGLPVGATAATPVASAQSNEWFDSRPDLYSAPQTASDAFPHQLQRQIQRLLADQVTPVRLAGHLSVLIVAAIILILSQVNVPDWDISLHLFPNSTLLGSGGTARGANRGVWPVCGRQRD